MDFRIENLKSTTLGGTRLTRRWMVDLQKTVARFSALSRHELASPCVVIWAGSSRRVGIDWGPAGRRQPSWPREDALVRLWQRRRRVLNTLVVVLCMSRWAAIPV